MSNPEKLRIHIENLGDNPKLFIHVECYCPTYKQKGTIKVQKKGDPSTEKVFSFGPVSTGNKYVNAENFTYDIANGTYYDVEVAIQNDQGKSNWTDSRIDTHHTDNAHPNYYEKMICSEDHSPELVEFNDTIVRFVWFSIPTL